MNGRAIFILASLLGVTVSTPALAGTCLTANIMAPQGMVITSPYGVDRTGRSGASPGYHQGVDIVNSAGSGTPIYSGSAGRVTYRHFSGGGVAANVISGDTKFVYLHMNNTAASGTSGSVAAGDKIGTMGCAGMNVCRPHLHLYTLLKGSSLAQSGYNGRTWLEFSGKRASPLTADAIKSATPEGWYYVNPEPFLPQQIPIRARYSDMQGGARTMSLPRTCTPGSNEAVATNRHSEGATQSAETSLASNAGGRIGSDDYSVKIADQPVRSLYLELARLNATELSANTLSYQAALDSALAHLVIKTSIDGPERQENPRP